MLTRWNDLWSDFDQSLAWMEAFRQQMDRVFEDFDTGLDLRASRGFPRTNLYDAGTALVLRAEVPGLSEKDVSVTMNQDVLTISGERKNDAPEGYAAHRRERSPVRFTRSLAFPGKIDMERVKASVKDGVLTVRLEKAAESQPRQIAVKAQ